MNNHSRVDRRARTAGHKAKPYARTTKTVTKDDSSEKTRDEEHPSASNFWSFLSGVSNILKDLVPVWISTAKTDSQSEDEASESEEEEELEKPKMISQNEPNKKDEVHSGNDEIYRAIKMTTRGLLREEKDAYVKMLEEKVVEKDHPDVKNHTSTSIPTTPVSLYSSSRPIPVHSSKTPQDIIKNTYMHGRTPTTAPISNITTPTHMAPFTQVQIQSQSHKRQRSPPSSLHLPIHTHSSQSHSHHSAFQIAPRISTPTPTTPLTLSSYFGSTSNGKSTPQTDLSTESSLDRQVKFRKVIPSNETARKIMETLENIAPPINESVLPQKPVTTLRDMKSLTSMRTPSRDFQTQSQRISTDKPEGPPIKYLASPLDKKKSGHTPMTLEELEPEETSLKRVSRTARKTESRIQPEYANRKKPETEDEDEEIVEIDEAKKKMVQTLNNIPPLPTSSKINFEFSLKDKHPPEFSFKASTEKDIDTATNGVLSAMSFKASDVSLNTTSPFSFGAPAVAANGSFSAPNVGNGKEKKDKKKKKKNKNKNKEKDQWNFDVKKMETTNRFDGLSEECHEAESTSAETPVSVILSSDEEKSSHQHESSNDPSNLKEDTEDEAVHSYSAATTTFLVPPFVSSTSVPVKPLVTTPSVTTSLTPTLPPTPSSTVPATIDSTTIPSPFSSLTATPAPTSTPLFAPAPVMAPSFLNSDLKMSPLNFPVASPFATLEKNEEKVAAKEEVKELPGQRFVFPNANFGFSQTTSQLSASLASRIEKGSQEASTMTKIDTETKTEIETMANKEHEKKKDKVEPQATLFVTNESQNRNESVSAFVPIVKQDNSLDNKKEEMKEEKKESNQKPQLGFFATPQPISTPTSATTAIFGSFAPTSSKESSVPSMFGTESIFSAQAKETQETKTDQFPKVPFGSNVLSQSQVSVPIAWPFGSAPTSASDKHGGINMEQEKLFEVSNKTSATGTAFAFSEPSMPIPIQQPPASSSSQTFIFGQSSQNNSSTFQFGSQTNATKTNTSSFSFGSSAPPTTPFASTSIFGNTPSFAVPFGSSSMTSSPSPSLPFGFTLGSTPNSNSAPFNFDFQTTTNPTMSDSSSNAFGSHSFSAFVQPAAPAVTPTFGQNYSSSGIEAPVSSGGFSLGAEPPKDRKIVKVRRRGH